MMISSVPFNLVNLIPGSPAYSEIPKVQTIMSYTLGRSSRIRRYNIPTTVSSHLMDASGTHEVIRRSANYQPNSWNYNFLTSLSANSIDSVCKYENEIEQLKEKVRKLLNDNSIGSLAGKLTLIDDILRLGLGNHFKIEIKREIKKVFMSQHAWFGEDLYTTSLQFRLLRLYGFPAPQDVFDRFKDESGGLKTTLLDDIEGILSLYEATYLSYEEEYFMDEAKAFTRTQLNNYMKRNPNPTLLTKKIAHSLEVPLHWRTQKLEARWYINACEREDHKVPKFLLDLAKMDFNVSQATYQSEIGGLLSWWVDLGLHKMEFARDSVVVNFFWSTSGMPDPQFSRFRVELAKVGVLITVIDDMYDVYGSLEELVLFTEAIERWDVRAISQLPLYMKICYMAVLNTCNDLAFKVLKEQGVDILSTLKKVWVDLCKSYLIEATWYSKGHTPTLDEYLENAARSIGSYACLTYAYVTLTEKITKELLDYIENFPHLMWTAGLLCRLLDDLATSSDEIARGDVAKSIQCYMHEEGVSHEVAFEHVKHLVNEPWKTLNKYLLDSRPLPEYVANAALDINRVAQCVYGRGDGHAKSEIIKDQMKLLLIEPIPITRAD